MTEKRVAIVTGGTRGIGKAICFALEKKGFKVIAIARSEKSIADLDQIAQQNSLDIITCKLDVSDTAAVNAAFDKIAEEHGGIAVLVNNAGITRDNLMMAMTDEEFDEVIATNLKSCFTAMRAACRPMIRKRWGRIINIASVSGVVGNAGQANYAASKAGMVGMTKSVAREFAKRGVTANCIAPGFITTDMTDVLPDKIKEMAKGSIPMNRFGLPEEIAAAVVFLASDEASYITGQTLCVDGGMTMC
ncbi:MAG: 3-oxoacyl-[acyl-carrier-protein] reductase [Sedimentisphaerales bacterium]|nr:3-oxoacyl-[acyl-carrier-protein] reductase [Sedimentisphaerales bacterium]MBN2841981.1 3-oxoacyl-[acyl-carrier-protein] reductase [Sedimentisphaerales bacterium]